MQNYKINGNSNDSKFDRSDKRQRKIKVGFQKAVFKKNVLRKGTSEVID